MADYVKESNGYSIYEIADGNNGWMQICPDAHNAYVNAVDKKHGGKVKPLIRFIKAWKFYRDVPIKSFYLEMRVAKYADGESCIIYDIDVKNILAMLLENNLSSLQDPMGFSGYIYPCKTEAFKQDAISKLSTAVSRAVKARNATIDGNVKEAFDFWNLLYNNKFPDYYL
ncbi:hypothetical protein [Comamonas suwonensis]|uniref:Uncharacterized protein n=1 Tax=Comamonas suwonensis TaxID=2606214 RepID=A0A843B4Y8_9BURK|nr:hypothetical protein [Comamonas suwonensis]MBI1626446.1 hypothetical protein [Comamonas suwonensis]